MTDATENAPEAPRTDPAITGRDDRGRFRPGNRGKPRGAKNKATRLLERLIEADAGRVGQACIAAALAGDVGAQRLIFERLLPARRPQSQAVHLPAVSEAEGLADKARAVVDAVAAGELAPDAGRMVLDSLAAVARIAEIAELESRIAALESAR